MYITCTPMLNRLLERDSNARRSKSKIENLERLEWLKKYTIKLNFVVISILSRHV